MTRRIQHLIEEHENRSKLFKTRDQDVEAGRTLKDPQNTEVPIPDTDEISPLISRKESQQHEVIIPRGDKNHNGKRNTETKLTGEKDR